MTPAGSADPRLRAGQKKAKRKAARLEKLLFPPFRRQAENKLPVADAPPEFRSGSDTWLEGSLRPSGGRGVQAERDAAPLPLPRLGSPDLHPFAGARSCSARPPAARSRALCPRRARLACSLPRCSALSPCALPEMSHYSGTSSTSHSLFSSPCTMWIHSRQPQTPPCREERAGGGRRRPGRRRRRSGRRGGGGRGTGGAGARSPPCQCSGPR